MPLKTHKYAIWLLLSLPAMVTLQRYWSDIITYGKVLHETGQWSAWLIVLSLAVTPLQKTFRNAAWTRWLLIQRRAIGVAGFSYAALHTLVYVIKKTDISRIIEEGLKLGLLSGWLALGIFFLLAATSNQPSVRLLRARWKKLHRLTYFASALTLLHWLMSAFNPVPAIAASSIIIGLQTARIILTRRGRQAQ